MDNDKKCWKCINYGALVNQGYRWCNKNKDMDHPEMCEDYNVIYDERLYDDITSSTTINTKKISKANPIFFPKRKNHK